MDEQARYIKIAKDIVNKILNDEFPEGSILKGRSLLASIYNVSPETIRKSVNLLANEKILYVKHGVGVFVDSKAKAQMFLEKFSKDKYLEKRSNRVKELLKQQIEINKALNDEMEHLIEDVKFQKNETITFNEVTVPSSCWLINKTLGEVNFWNYTEATIVAIKRNEDGLIQTSPGPDLPIKVNDTLIFVGKDKLSYERVIAFLKYGIED